MQLEQIDVTGCRLIGAINNGLGHDGPKHHAVVLGRSLENGHVYIAESMGHGYQVATYADFYKRYSSNGKIQVEANDGTYDNLTVAKRALEDIRSGGEGLYHVVVNNCECFVNRAMHGESKSRQVINTALGLIAVFGVLYYIKRASN